MGGDEIHPHMLKKCANSMCSPLYLIFLKSLQEGKVPDAWKDANVSPLFKKGSKVDPANYRPVSLTSVTCKILESIIRDQLMNYLVTNDLLAKEQHGFVNKKACVTNLLETKDFATRALALKHAID